MNFFLKLEDHEQRQYFEQTGTRLRLPPESVEKDFWVCWTLDHLFNLPGWNEHLTFKGGTSLSKGWKLIERFSEDIDIVVDKDSLGFGGENSPESAPTISATRKRLKKLKQACQRTVCEELKPELLKVVHAELPEEMPWEVILDENDPDEQTILLRYPSLFRSGPGYLLPQVKIELGARSDTEPLKEILINSYLEEEFPDLKTSDQVYVRAILPERTFWEKAFLLHEENFRPQDKPKKGRLARHYYDLACMIRKGVSTSAVELPGLFERTARHREIYFKQTWMDYDSLKRGTLRISPKEENMDYWRKDYSAMESMFFGEAPPFDKIISILKRFEDDFNGS